MPRARNIKPGFFKNADLVELSMEARLLFIGLWTLADRAGRLEDRPKQIKMELFPADAVDVDECLNGLARWGFVKRYEVDGRRLLQVVNFNKHQNPHKDEKLSALPNEHGHLDAPKCKPDAGTVQAQCKDSSDTVGIVLIPDSGFLIPETLGEKPAAPAAPLAHPKRKKPVKTPLPADFGISPRVEQWAQAKGYTKLLAHLEAFVSKCKANAYAYADWDEAFMNAIRDDWAKLRAPPTNARGFAAPPITVKSDAAERTAAETAQRLAPLTPEQKAAADAARRAAMAAIGRRTA